MSEEKDFISIEFLLDSREAQKKYEEEYKGDTSFTMSFDEWLEIRKFEVAKQYLINHKLNPRKQARQ